MLLALCIATQLCNVMYHNERYKKHKMPLTYDLRHVHISLIPV